MKAIKLCSLAMLTVSIAAPGAAWGASAVGRTTYIYPDNHRIVLDSSDEYVVGQRVDVSKLAIAELVRVTFSEQNGERVATDIAPEQGSAAKRAEFPAAGGLHPVSLKERKNRCESGHRDRMCDASLVPVA